ncbi:restriction endonuclease subunit S [Clostridium sp. Mt-5]|uniref:Restriction endonuclease subunit S n=1 Tax=Clostridium moutaii TaxID=3240932 RepID=A0ABV4BQS8_9CLOT
MSKMYFKDIIVAKDGMIKGPFGSDIKKSLFVPKGKNTYKVYEQGVVYNSDVNYGNYYITEQYYHEKMERFKVKAGDILITGAGTLGELFIMPQSFEPGIINQALIRIRLNESKIDKQFFKYYFFYYIKTIVCNINGDSVIPNLPPLSVIKETEINIPDLIEQRKIANILNNIDEKISNNDKIALKLEKIICSIFNFWFYQFQFPDSSNLSYKYNGGKMYWNEELEINIPIGWTVDNLSSIINVTMGSSPKGDSINVEKNGIIFYQGKTDFGVRYPYIRAYSSKPVRYAEAGDVLLSVRAPVGALNCAYSKCCIGRGIAALNYKYHSYLYYLMLENRFQFDKYNKEGTTFGSINRDTLKSLKIINPPENIIKKFEEKVEGMDNQIRNYYDENLCLEETKKFLLPLLMNRKVTFKDQQ